MLTRRRQQQRRGGAMPSTFSVASSESQLTSSTQGAVTDHLRAFAAFPLPCLMAQAVEDERSASAYAAELELSETPPPPRARVSHALLLMFLHIGNDPPDYPRLEPYAKYECWIDPMVAQFAPYTPQQARGGSDGIAEALEAQYRTAVLRDKDVGFLRVIEGNVESARSALLKARRLAHGSRLLVHYNGHGMPQATKLGEVWMFNRDRTHYVPLNILEMAELGDSPTVYVIDCNAAGAVLQRWYAERLHEHRPYDLFICACTANEMLPLSPALPADVLTSCLTTPLKMALEWYIGFSQLKILLPQVTDEMVRNIPGDLMDPRTPQGDLQLVLTAVTETVAWCTMEPTQFQYLFRQDGSTTSLFRNAVLADWLIRGIGCTPVLHPPLSEEAHLHPMWELWVYTVERTVSQLPALLSPETPEVYVPSSFLSDQLTAFEVWIDSGDLSELPEQLPSVVLALSQAQHQLRIFTLLVKYLDASRVAGKRAIRCGVLQYMGRLMSQKQELFLVLTVLWMQLIRADPAAGCAEVQKYQCEKYFTSLLRLDERTTQTIAVEYGQSGGVLRPSVARGSSQPSATVSPAALSPIPQSRGVESPSPTPGATFPAATVPGRRAAGPLAAEGADSSNSNPTDAPPQPMQPMLAPTKKPTASPAPTLRIPQPGGSSYYLLKDMTVSRCKSMACYILCQFLLRGERQCILCWNNRLLNAAFPILSSTNAEVRSWGCLVLSTLFSGLRHAKNFASRECASRVTLFTHLLEDRSPVVRSSCVTLLGSVVGVRVDTLATDQQLRRLQMEKSLLIKLRGYLFDASVNVRMEIIFFCCQILHTYKGALPPRHGDAMGEYVQGVGRTEPTWTLEESEVGVKSLLHSSRPTVSSLFDDAVVFETTLITGDDPAPISKELDAQALGTESLTIVQGLLHDAALMLCTLYSNCDTGLVEKALKDLTDGVAPLSSRFEAEAQRTMSHIVSTDSDLMSEKDRARTTWNADTMRQLVLDLQERKLEPQRTAEAPPPKSSVSVGGSLRHSDVDEMSTSVSFHTAREGGSPLTTEQHTSGTQDPWAIAGAWQNTSSRYQIVSGAVRSDTVVASCFRVLEPALVVATRNQQVHYISYESYSSQSVVKSFPLALSGPVHDMRVINDLSEQSGLLVVNKRGGFTLLKECWERDATPTEAAVFSACPPPSPGSWVDIKMTYRSNSATLFYGGPVGTNGATAINVLSLADEQVVQQLEVSGSPALTCLVCHTTQRAMLAGFSDATVRYYDDRQAQGHMGVVGLLPCRGEGNEEESVVGVGSLAGGTHQSVVAATPSMLRVFDVRKLKEPVLALPYSALLASACQRQGAAERRIASCSVGIHTGLIGLSFTDNTYAAYNAKGVILNDRPIPMYASAASPTANESLQRSSPAPVMLSKCCVAHPMRPMLSFGCDLMILQ